MKEKIPPHSKESEMMVLGCMLTGPAALRIACDSLEDSDFYFTEHKLVFESLKASFIRDRPADILIISEDLKRRDRLDDIGGMAYLTTLAQYAGTSAFIEEYVDLIRSRSILRSMLLASEIVQKTVLEDPKDVNHCLDNAQQLFFRISQTATQTEGVPISDIFSGLKSEYQESFLEALEKRFSYYTETGQEVISTGIPSHFIDLDKMLQGFSNSNLMILAARPAMGKTAFALNLAENICFKNNMPVGIFSLEMSADQLIQRVVSSRSGIESSRIKTGSLSATEYGVVVGAVNYMQKQMMIIDDESCMTIGQLRSRARRMKEKFGIRFLVIDYLQLLSGSGRGGENRQYEISEISRQLKGLARELNIPILCLSQLSRKVEERPGHIPMMSDLRDSGSIEQDADIVLFLRRREYYDPMDRPGEADLIVAKNRHGDTGVLRLTFRREFARFENHRWET